MGFFKKLMSKPFKTLFEVSPAGMIAKAAGLTGDKKSESSAPAPAPTSFDTTTLSDDELTAEAQKRLARLGKYFTSPLGVLQNASTASQRVFS
jgi:hypothetical protein